MYSAFAPCTVEADASLSRACSPATCRSSSRSPASSPRRRSQGCDLPLLVSTVAWIEHCAIRAEVYEVALTLRAAALPQLKATFLTIQCKECKNTKRIVCKPGMGGAMIPRYCDMGGAPGGPGGNNCGVDCFNILPNRSGYVDQQQLKLQVGQHSIGATAAGSLFKQP